MFAPAEFLSLEHTAHPKLFEAQKYVWDALRQIASYLQFRLKPAVLGELVGKPFISNAVFIGAGVILSNVKLDHREIIVAAADGEIATGLTKFGAIVGDRTEIGCNAVINPGSVLGRDCLIYPGANFRGVLPSASVVKVRQNLQVLTRRALDAQ